MKSVFFPLFYVAKINEKQQHIGKKNFVDAANGGNTKAKNWQESHTKRSAFLHFSCEQ